MRAVETNRVLRSKRFRRYNRVPVGIDPQVRTGGPVDDGNEKVDASAVMRRQVERRVSACLVFVTGIRGVRHRKVAVNDNSRPAAVIGGVPRCSVHVNQRTARKRDHEGQHGEAGCRKTH